ncbi:MAG: DUF2911 domain-containing protein [Cyclobacteriaceae bacterium]|nr:DUF2911 domain-containing protein [Cyclobacteriaceae bacterium]
MKNFLTPLAAVVLLTMGFSMKSTAQESPSATAQNTIDGVSITIEYHSPKVKERIIWGGLVPYDKVWRTGADAATTLEVSDDVNIEGHTIPKGKYALFTIPQKGDTWTVILSNKADQWGAFNYKQEDDFIRFDVKGSRTVDLHESLQFDITDEGIITFAWEYKTFSLKVEK